MYRLGLWQTGKVATTKATTAPMAHTTAPIGRCAPELTAATA